MRQEIVEGLQLVRRHPVLVPLTLRSIFAQVAGSFYGVLYTIYLIQDLHLSPFLLGIVVSAGGVGSLVGSFFASRVIAQFGSARPSSGRPRAPSIVGVLTPLAGGPLLLATADGVHPAAGRRRPPDDRGRGRALAHPGGHPRPDPGPGERHPRGVLARVAYPLGALTAAAVAGWIGVRGAIAIGWAGMALSILLLVLSPLPGIRQPSDVAATSRTRLPGVSVAQVFRVGDERAEELALRALVRGLPDRQVALKWSAWAACKCHSPGGMWTVHPVDPGRIAACLDRPTPCVTCRVCPSVCCATRCAPPAEADDITRTRDGASPRAMTSTQTSPVNRSAEAP